jgi:hypothetical protein
MTLQFSKNSHSLKMMSWSKRISWFKMSSELEYSLIRVLINGSINVEADQSMWQTLPKHLDECRLWRCAAPRLVSYISSSLFRKQPPPTCELINTSCSSARINHSNVALPRRTRTPWSRPLRGSSPRPYRRYHARAAEPHLPADRLQRYQHAERERVAERLQGRAEGLERKAERGAGAEERCGRAVAHAHTVRHAANTSGHVSNTSLT